MSCGLRPEDICFKLQSVKSERTEAVRDTVKGFILRGMFLTRHMREASIFVHHYASELHSW